MADCERCGRFIVLSLQDGKLREAEIGGWKAHVCAPPQGTVMECVCATIVRIDGDGARFDWPSGTPHALHEPRRPSGSPQEHGAERKQQAKRGLAI